MRMWTETGGYIDSEKNITSCEKASMMIPNTSPIELDDIMVAMEKDEFYQFIITGEYNGMVITWQWGWA